MRVRFIRRVGFTEKKIKKIKNDAAFKEQIEATKAQNHQQENTEEAEEIIESALIEENQEVTSVTEHEVSE